LSATLTLDFPHSLDNLAKGFFNEFFDIHSNVTSLNKSCYYFIGWQPHPDVVYRDGDGSDHWQAVKIYWYWALPDILPVSRTGIVPLIRSGNQALAYRIIVNVVCQINNGLNLCYVTVITTAFLPETIRPVYLRCCQIFQAIRIVAPQIIYCPA